MLPLTASTYTVVTEGGTPALATTLRIASPFTFVALSVTKDGVMVGVIEPYDWICRVTVPVNRPLLATVIVELFEDPSDRVRLPGLASMVKSGGAMVTAMIVSCSIAPEVAFTLIKYVPMVVEEFDATVRTDVAIGLLNDTARLVELIVTLGGCDRRVPKRFGLRPMVPVNWLRLARSNR